jgi:hypothetical protein
MRGFLKLSATIVIVIFLMHLIFNALIFLMPLIFIAVIFSIVAAALLILLANFGLLPGVTLRRRVWIKNDATRAGRRRKIQPDKDERVSEENKGGHGFYEDNEVIILPETALRKDEHAKPRPPGPFSG